jgi:hypothetical protein
MSKLTYRPTDEAEYLRAAELVLKLVDVIAGEDDDGIVVMAFTGAIEMWAKDGGVSLKWVMDHINRAMKRKAPA